MELTHKSTGILKKLISSWPQQYLALRACLMTMKGLVLVFVLSLSSSLLFAKCHLNVRTANHPPQYYINEDGQWSGLAVEIAKALLAEANCTVSFKETPWARALHLMEHGGLDIITNISKTPEREVFMYFVGPIRDETMVMLVPKDFQYPIDQLYDLKQLDKGIGIIRGAFYGEEFAAKLKNDAEFNRVFEQTSSTKTNVEKLKHGRIAGLVGDKYNIVYLINNALKRGTYAIHPFAFNSDNVYFGLSKKSVAPQRLKQLQAAYE